MLNSEESSVFAELVLSYRLSFKLNREFKITVRKSESFQNSILILISTNDKMFVYSGVSNLAYPDV